MPEIKIQHVVSYSSQETNNPAENLLKPDGTHKWKNGKVGEKQSSVVLQFEKASIIHSIDIGNDSSAFVEVLVGRSSSDKDFQVILVASSFMSPMESRNNTNKNSVRMFGAEKLSKTVASEKWDRVKIVCTQPFNKNTTYGLSFIKFHSPPENPTASTPGTATPTNDDLINPKKIGAFFFRKDEEKDEDVKVGSLFARHKEKTESPPLTVAAAIREASNEMRSSYTENKNSNSSPHTPTSSGTKRKHDRSDDEDGAEKKKGKSSRTEEHPASRSKDEEKSSHRHKEDHEKSKHSRQEVKKEKKSSSHRDDSKHHRNSSNSHHNNSSSSKPLSSKSQELSKGDKPFHNLLEGVVFVLSGFQNPFRADLRDKAIEMGAKYRPDWMDGCTHLVCAFANTPKYAQVKGKGRIVTKHWIMDCYKQKTVLNWKKYRLVDDGSGKEDSGDEKKAMKSSQDLNKTSSSQKKESKHDPDVMSLKQDESPIDDQSEDDTDDEVRRFKESEKKKKSPAKSKDSALPQSSSSLGDTLPLDEEENYDVATDVDEDDDDSSEGEMPELPDFLAKKHFFLYGELNEKERHDLVRYIVAYNGQLEDYMNEKVDFVITAERWDDNFDDALTNYPQLTFVRPRWLYKCNEKNKWVPYQPHIVIP